MRYRPNPHKISSAWIAWLAAGSLTTALATAAFATGAEPDAVDDFDIPVELGADSIEILFSTLRQNDSYARPADLSVSSRPAYGSLQTGTDRFIYTPDPAFWSLGLDAFVYTLEDPTGQASASVHLYALRDDQLLADEGFEGSEGYVASSSYHGNTVEVSDLARAEGAKGLMVSVTEGHAYATIEPPKSGGDPPEPGGVRLIMTCPPDPPPGNPLSFAAVGGNDPFSPFDPPSLRLMLMHSNAVRVEVYDSIKGTYKGSQQTSLGGEMATLEVDWYRTGEQLGALLRVDGRAVSTPLVINPDPTLDHLHIGVLQPASSELATTIGFDHLEWFEQRTPGDPEISPVHFADAVESGDLSAWTNTVGTDLWVRADPLARQAISGSYELSADSTGDSYLIDGSPHSFSPHGDEELTVTFRLDIGSASMVPGDDKTLYAFGSDPLDVTPGSAELSLRLYGGLGSEPRMFLSVLHNGNPSSTPSASLNPGVNRIAIQYRVAEEALTPTGYARLWINGVEAVELRELTNHAQAAAWSHLGAYGASAPGLVGTLYLDDYVSAGRLPLASPAP